MKINVVEVNKLIDMYGSLLTAKQYDIITSYYFENLSLSEIGDNLGVSRQAISDSINQTIKILLEYEEKLQFVKKIDSAELRLRELSRATEDDFMTKEIQTIIDNLRS